MHDFAEVVVGCVEVSTASTFAQSYAAKVKVAARCYSGEGSLCSRGGSPFVVPNAVKEDFHSSAQTTAHLDIYGPAEGSGLTGSNIIEAV